MELMLGYCDIKLVSQACFADYVRAHKQFFVLVFGKAKKKKSNHYTPLQ